MGYAYLNKNMESKYTSILHNLFTIRRGFECTLCWTHYVLLMAFCIALLTPASPAYAQMKQSTIPQPSQGPNIILLSQRYNDGTLVGEVMNNGTSVAESVRVSASFYDVNGNIVAAKTSYANPSTLRPGERSSFNIFTLGEAVKRNAETYEFVLQWLDAEGKEDSRRVIAEEDMDQQVGHNATGTSITEIPEPQQIMFITGKS